MLFMDSIYLSNRYISYINPKATLVVICSLMLLFFCRKIYGGVSMSLKDISLDEVLSKGIITKGAWNSDDWDVTMPIWKKALSFAEYHYKTQSVSFIDRSKEVRTGTKQPYIIFVNKILKCLMDEANLCGDRILTIAALYKLTELTKATLGQIRNEFGDSLENSIKQLIRHESETFPSYVKRCSEFPNGISLVSIILAHILTEERYVDICPTNSVNGDIDHYNQLITEITMLDDELFVPLKWSQPRKLSELIIHRLKENKKISINVNESEQELFEGCNAL